ncbi:MAG: hypothetical protein V2A69_10425 [Pseudomonadota bacterium]
MEESKEPRRDYFFATFDTGGLVLEPHCACGNYLSEEYFCEQCQKQCLCTEIRCKDKETLAYVTRFLKDNEQFRNFRAVIDENNEERND